MSTLRYLFTCIICIFIQNLGLGQAIGINNDNSLPNEHSIIDITATNKGMLIPRMTTTERNTFSGLLGNKEIGMMVFDTEEGHFYFWKEGSFHRLDLSSRIIDTDEDTEIRVEETPDDDIIRFYAGGDERWNMIGPRLEPISSKGSILIGKEAGFNSTFSKGTNIALGSSSLYSSMDRINNIAIGDSSLLRNGIGSSGVREGNDNIGIGKKTLENNNIGAQNLAIGSFSLQNNLGNSNTALGHNTLNSNTEGDANIAVGHNALELNRTGENNVGLGLNTLQKNSSGSNNIAIGSNSLSTNGSASNSIAIGTDASRGNSISGTIAIGDSTLMVNGTGSTLPYQGFWLTAIGHQVLRNNTTGRSNTGIGHRALTENTIGQFNSALGSIALRENISGNYNIAIGTAALRSNTVGNANTAVGYLSMSTNIDGITNTAVGYRALTYNEDGDRNVGIGNSALLFNRTGNRNVAMGSSALYRNTTGNGNVAIGDAALYNSTNLRSTVAIGDSTLFNFRSGNILYIGGIVAVGYKSQFENISGQENTSLGTHALQLNRTGNGNTAIGSLSLWQNRGDNSTAVGRSALSNTSSGDENTAVGSLALSGYNTRNRRTAIGYSANSTGNNGNNAGIGNDADCTAAHQVRIGNDAVTSIGGYANWTNISDGNFKKDVQENVVGLAFIDQLRPVTYKLDLEAVHDFYRVNYREDKQKRYEEQSAAGTMIRSGFIAQEVEAVAQNLGYDFSGVDAPKNKKDFYGLRYAAFVVPLVKAVQEQQDIIDTQEARLSNLEGKLRQMEKLFYADIKVVK